MLNRGAQLADVTRPIVGKQCVHCIRCEFEKWLLVLLAEMSQKSADEDRDVLFSVAQRRHYNSNDVEAKIEVIPEFSCADELFEVFVRGCNQTHIGA